MLVVVLSTTQVSTMFLIREIFTKEATKWWFRVIVLMVVAQAIIGSLLISVGCSPAHILGGKDNDKCLGNVSLPPLSLCGLSSWFIRVVLHWRNIYPEHADPFVK
jgi:hypothetical protein